MPPTDFETVVEKSALQCSHNSGGAMSAAPNSMSHGHHGHRVETEVSQPPIAVARKTSVRKSCQRGLQKDSSAACSECTKASLSEGGRETAEGGGKRPVSRDGAGRPRRAEKLQEIRQAHRKRRNEARQSAGGGVPAGTVLFRPKDRTVSFRALSRPAIVRQLCGIPGVAAVRVNFQRNVVAVDGADRSAVLALVATDSIGGLDVLGRELAARPGTSSGVIYDHYNVKGRLTAEGVTEIVSSVPLVSYHPTQLGCSMLLRFDAPSPPPEVTVIDEHSLVQLDVKPNRPRPLQCGNCGRFNHATPSCLHPSRCMRCGKTGDHSHDLCTAEPKCGNCSRPHAMTDRRCRIWKQERRVEAALTAPNVTSRRSARISVRAAYRDLRPRIKKLRRRRPEGVKKTAVAPSPPPVEPKASPASKQPRDKLPKVAFVPSVFLTAPPPTVQKGNQKALAGVLGAKLPHAKEATCQKKAATERCVDAAKARPKGQLTGGLTSGKGTSTQRASTMPSSRPTVKQSTAAAVSQWSSFPATSKCCSASIHSRVENRASGARCQSKNTCRTASKTVALAPGQAAAVSSSSSKNGASAKAQAPHCDQEEAFLGVLAQLARALQSGYDELSAPAENCKAKKKGKQQEALTRHGAHKSLLFRVK
uniref:Tick transposon n=1 Tax=Rhipicephalus zambeziensis TaxID=60191 RepID=A0A224YQG9_9ACAR